MKQWRVNLTLIFLFLFAAALTGRLIFLQVFQGDLYAALAKGQQNIFETQEGERGEIFMANHALPVATNKIVNLVFASPDEITSEKKEETAQALSDVLGLGKESVLEKLQKDSLYEVIKDRASDEEVAALEEKKLVGIYSSENILRDYPYGDFAAHLLGFVNSDGEGQYGLEGYWDKELAGKESFFEGELGPLGHLFFGGDNKENQGSDLYLTVDYNIQYQAEKLLQKASQNLKIEGGTVVVMDPNSGKILALANLPSFNPNEYYKESDFNIFQLSATQKIFEPGSIFKPITMAGALNEGKITPETTYNDPGKLVIDGWPITNYEERIYPGNITMTEVLEKSINTGAVFAESRLGNGNFLDYVRRFGIFDKTGVDLAGEETPQNVEFKQGHDVNFATASFGQGIEMTPLQIARAFAAIANGGKLVKPYVVDKIENSEGEVTETVPEISQDRIISVDTATKLTTMLVSVVDAAFTRAAQIPGYFVAGKTGTAQISWAALGIDKKGYSEKTWQSFVGFAPAYDPKFLILIKLDNPQTKTAEYSAAPLFKELAKYIIDYLQIPPDRMP
jgi:cell division protein FtsI/penicillin-binding protein 2